MKKIVILCLFLLNFLCLSSISAQVQKTAAAVMELEAREGISQSIASMLSDYLRTQLVNNELYIIVTRENMEQILKEQQFQMSGCTSQECIVEMGQLLGVRKIFTGSIGKIGLTYLVTVKIVDVQSGQIEKAVTEECSDCKEDAVLVSIRNIVKKMMGLPPDLAEKTQETTSAIEHNNVSDLKPLYEKEVSIGSLLIDSFPEKGKIYLNNIDVGKAPFSSDKILSGLYRLEIIKDGFVDFESPIQVPVGSVEKIYVKLGVKNSKRIESPGYAYETKVGIRLRAIDEIGDIGAGFSFYSPYLHFSALISAFSTVYLYSDFTLPWTVESSINIPNDWWSFQFGMLFSAYSYKIKYGEHTYGSNYKILGFPVGLELFFNSHFSFASHVGPAYYMLEYNSDGTIISSENWSFCGNLIELNIYF